MVNHDLIVVRHVPGYGWVAICDCGRMYACLLGTRSDVVRLWLAHTQRVPA